MKSRDTLIRLKKFQVDEKRRRVAQIEGMIADFQRMSNDLEREIQLEQERAGKEYEPGAAEESFTKSLTAKTRETRYRDPLGRKALPLGP